MLLTPMICPERQIQKARVELLQYPGVSTAAAKPSAGKIGASYGCKVRPQLLAPPYLPPQHPPRHSSGRVGADGLQPGGFRFRLARVALGRRLARGRRYIGVGAGCRLDVRLGRPHAEGQRPAAAAAAAAREEQGRRGGLGLGLRCPKSSLDT